MYELNSTLAKKVLAAVDAGLVQGLGKPVPGQMCVEAAVCYAMGLPHSDKPRCVGAVVRAFKISLNDAAWSSNEARTLGMRKLAIAQLGSDAIDQKAFRTIVTEQTIRRILPAVLRAAALEESELAEVYEMTALECENTGTTTSSYKAKMMLERRGGASRTAYCTYVGDFAAIAANPVYCDSQAGSYAASAARFAAVMFGNDEMLMISADIGLQALIALNSPGCEYLYLVSQ